MEQSKSRPARKGKKKKAKVMPNPDEVVDIERPGSSTSHQSRSSLFSADAKTDDTAEGARTEETNLDGSYDENGSTSLHPSPRPASPSVLPFKSTKVAPAEQQVDGSQTSIRSREAWAGEEVKKDEPSRPVSAKSNTEKHRTEDYNNQRSKDDDAQSIRSSTSTALLSPPRMKGEEHAYIPYLYARDTIVKIVEDMQGMKDNHVHAVHQIEFNYQMIEDETQRQFNAFVLNLRNVYKGKVSVFKHIITIHRKDTENKQLHWDNRLKSMAEKNQKLLKEKKALLIQHKVMTDKMATAREDATRELIIEMDALNLKLAKVTKEYEENTEKQEAESKVLRDSLEQEKQEVVALRAQLRDIPDGAIVTTSHSSDEPVVTSRDELQTSDLVIAPTTVTKEVIVDMSEKERTLLAEERQKLIDEMNKQRDDLEKERSEFIADRKKLNDEKNELQKSVNDSKKEIAGWRAKYEANATQLQRFTSLRKDYDTLLAAYNVLIAAGVTIDAAKADEKIVQSTESKVALDEDKKGLEEDIKKWEVEFEKKNGREPKEDDQPENIQEFKIMLAETNQAIQNLEVEVSTMEKLKAGEMPTPPTPTPAAQQAVTVAEPVIKTVEVTVPDPEIVKKLELTEGKVDNLQKVNSENKKKIADLQNETAKLKSEIQDLEAKLKRITADHAHCNKTILKLTNKVKDESKKVNDLENQLKAKGKMPIAAAASATVEVDTDDKTEKTVVPLDEDNSQRIRELEERIEELEEELENAKLGETTPAINESDTEKIAELEEQVDNLEKQLRQEEQEHKETKEEMDSLKLKIKSLEDGIEAARSQKDDDIKVASVALTAQLAKKEKELTESKARVTDLEAKMMANLPPDAATEMKKLLKKIQTLTKDNDAQSKKASEIEEKFGQLSAEKSSLDKILAKEKQTNEQTQAKLKSAKEDKQKEIGKLSAQWDKKEKTRVAENKAKVEALQKKIKELESRPAAPVAARPEKAAKGGAADAKSEKQIKALTETLQEKKKENKELQAKIQLLQEEAKKAKSEAGGDIKEQKKQEKVVKELAKKLDLETKKAERDGAKAKELETTLAAVTKEKDTHEAEIKKLKAEMGELGVAAAQSIELTEKVKVMETEVKELNKETAKLTEAYNTERVQRKKYFNMVEDMKGKIRVYCRARPMSGMELERGFFSVIQSPDEYSLNVQSSRGLKDFNFDRVFMPEHSQDQVFEDTYHLVQSAADGYNVCIFAYGQTGSGKTYTMIGAPSSPGIAPRAFKRIFEVIEENKDKFDYKVTSYMLELYNDKLLDLYAGSAGTPDEKMEIKKDKAGLVFVRGAVVKEAPTEEALYALFEEGSSSRHVASTKMNAESSRSHLVLSVIIEGTNKTNGQVNRGKLSLVDLAGSERVGKTGATAETLKEANSINKSLAALGNVISALSTEQSFIPYRDNKLTQLMQDSLGGNAKTLMFVNISPADYNADETVTSLTYASRVKLITNDAQKNSDNKEIAKLKALIAKMKAGDDIEEEV